MFLPRILQKKKQTKSPMDVILRVTSFSLLLFSFFFFFCPLLACDSKLHTASWVFSFSVNHELSTMEKEKAAFFPALSSLHTSIQPQAHLFQGVSWKQFLRALRWPANAGDVRDVSSVSELGGSPEGGNGSPLQ